MCPLDYLRKRHESVRDFEDVVVISPGDRLDWIDKEILNLIDLIPMIMRSGFTMAYRVPPANLGIYQSRLSVRRFF